MFYKLFSLEPFNSCILSFFFFKGIKALTLQFLKKKLLNTGHKIHLQLARPTMNIY